MKTNILILLVILHTGLVAPVNAGESNVATAAIARTALSAQGGEILSERSWADRLEYVGVAVQEKDYHVWGSSPVVGPEGKTHLFVSRWPIAKGFGAWLTHCEIARYVSDSPEGPFEFKEVVVKGSGGGGWDHQSPHNPNIQKVGDRYALVYIANRGGQGKARASSQRIGMLVADHPAGPWKKAGEDGLLLAPPTDADVWSVDSVVGVNNPALMVHPDGRFFLYYKAMRKGDVRRMGVAIADQLEGPYVFEKEPLTSNDTTIEDGYAFQEDGKLCLLTTHNDAGAGFLWTSDDGLSFGAPILGYDKMHTYVGAETVNGATIVRGKKFERPQVLVVDGKPTHLYLASGANWIGGKGSVSCVFRIKGK
ncbi:glycoside hydrolase family protein [Pontiellaceae bacterium B1224]|nr:glycoside hydrolase family protein [Pontiellaceae bacterium B1224]